MKLSSQPFVSIVTPVYNGEKYLTECIESVIAQNYENWEYIIVNNCSTDRTLEIAKNYGEKDSRVRIHNNKEFLDVIQNHNNAFRLIAPQSKYCKILQSDDFLFPDCLMKMIKVAEDNPSVAMVGSYSLWGDRVKCDGVPYTRSVISGREICRLSLLGRIYLFLSPSSLLIRSDIIRKYNKFWNEAHLYADAEACYEVLQDSDFGFVHQILTCIRKHDESMTSSVEKMNALMLSNLDLLVKYGPKYLKREEYEEALKQKLWFYYRLLGQSVFQRKGKEFWDFHKNGLKNVGHPLNYFKLIVSSIRVLANRMLGRFLTY